MGEARRKNLYRVAQIEAEKSQKRSLAAKKGAATRAARRLLAAQVQTA